jgi:hypothetical protein
MSDRSTLIRPTLALAIATVLMAGAVPAFAADREGAAPPVTAPQPVNPEATKYCIATADLGERVTTGTILTPPKRQCLTRSQWEAKGVTFKVK